MAKIGERVFAIWGAKNNVNRMAGWGQFLGDVYCDIHPVSSVLTEEYLDEYVDGLMNTTKQDFEFVYEDRLEQLEEVWVNHCKNIEQGREKLKEEFRKSVMSNPCILLDSGEKVWGFQCWWGTESQWVKKGFDKLEWEIVLPSEYIKNVDM